jgi:hypothetical protein
MLETTENVNLFLPIIFALFISFAVGRIFNRSLYAASLNFKSVPFLTESVPPKHQLIKAEAVMSRPVTCLAKKTSVESIYEILQDSTLNGVPVVESLSEDKRLIGMITRDTLIVVLKNLNAVPEVTSRNSLLNQKSSPQTNGGQYSSPRDLNNTMD